MKYLIVMLFMFCCWLSWIPVTAQSATMPQPWKPALIDPQPWGIEAIQSITCDAGQRKLYVGARSRDAARRGLYVFDLAADNSLIDPPRRYSDHPDALPEKTHSNIVCMLLDARHRKLFLGISSAQPNFTTTLVMYNLDAKGEPTGKPEAFATGNPYFACQAIALHPKLNRLYTVGFGGGGVYVLNLDDAGRPAAPPIAIKTVGNGKFSLAFRSDGSKLYLGTHPSTLEVCDLDVAGNVVNKPRSYAVPNGPKVYMLLAANDRAVYFKGVNDRLQYFRLNTTGEPTGQPVSVETITVQGVLTALADHLVVAEALTFKDALNGKLVTCGSRIRDYSLAADGSIGRIVRETEPHNRQAVTSLGVSPSVGFALGPSMRGFLGNRFAGLNLRVTVLDVDTASPLPAHAKSFTMSPQKKVLRIAYSPSRGMVYATGENIICAYPLKGDAEAVVTTPCPNAGDQVALDETAGVLYIAAKDGTVLARKLQANGQPAATGDTLDTGIRPIATMHVHPKTHQLYVFGLRQPKVQVTDKRIVPVTASQYLADTALDTAKGRLYACGAYNGNTNLYVWTLAPDGTLVKDQPRTFDDGLPLEEKPARGMLTALKIDPLRHRLYCGGQLERATMVKGGLVVYTLDAQGDPIGKPRFTAAPGGTVNSLELPANGKMLYLAGRGEPRLFTIALNAAGDPTGDPLPWLSLLKTDKTDLTLTASGSTLLAGAGNSALEMLALRPDGQPVGAVAVTFQITNRPVSRGTPPQMQKVAYGALPLGIASSWANLDEGLQNLMGYVGGRLTISGVPVTKATVKFETALADGKTYKPLATVTSTVDGDFAVLFLPLYGQDDMAKVAGMVQSTAMRYKQYFSNIEAATLKPEERPKQFVIANGLIPMDKSLEAFEYGVRTLVGVGHNTAQIWAGIDPKKIRAILDKYGISHFRYAVYNPPSYFDYNAEMITPAYLDAWAVKYRDNVTAMGGKPDELSLFHMADEPGWYFPAQLETVKAKPERLAVFRNYLKAKGFTPDTFGKATWDDIVPMPLSGAKTLPDKRLLYWTARFFTESLSSAFAAATSALQRQLNPKLYTTTNLNNWPGRFFIPSPGKKIANNADIGPDTAMGMPDWFDLGRKKAVSCIWTEDWFGDQAAQQWSFYGDLLRCAAREGGIEYGGYTVGHGIGGVDDGATYKVMALTGHGAKAIDPYTFGPNPAFADGWSDNPGVYKPLSAALRMLGKSERLLYPGRPKTGTVAILLPKASQVWDGDSAVKSYLSEVYGLHAGLIHQQYPVDFVDDYDIEEGALQKYGYATLYITAPNLSAKAQQAVLNWVKAGGTLAVFPGACLADEYNEPISLLPKAMGASWGAVTRVATPRADEMPVLSAIPVTLTDTRLGATADATRFQAAPLTLAGAKSLAKFADGKPAIAEMPLEKGRVVSFGYWPGLTYWNSPDRLDRTLLPQRWAESTRKVVTLPARLANARKYVEISAEIVEGAVLESDKGLAVTLLNWTGDPLKSITVAIPSTRYADAVKAKRLKVESVEQGVLKYELTGDTLKVTMPLRTVDVLLISL